MSVIMDGGDIGGGDKPIATISGSQPTPESEMDALLLGRTGELVISTPNQRNWRGILIALLVIVAVLGLIVFSIVLVSPPEEGPRVKGKRPTLKEVLGPQLKPTGFNGSWISDTEFVFRDVFGGISVYNAENLTSRTLMTNLTFRQLNAIDFKVSSNLRYILLISDVTTVFKYTKLARYHVVEVATRLKFPLSYKEDDDKAPLLQYATWSPDGIGVAFVYDNDVYYKPQINKSLVCRITTDGIPDTIFNGVPDWLYENEILHTGHALWFSNDGKYLMYMTFNDTNVGDYRYSWYHSGGTNPNYPSIRSLRYPKVNTLNPEVTVWAVNLKRPKYLFPTEIKPTNSVEANSYVTSVSWYGDHHAAVVWLNRRQNMSVIVTCKAPTFNCSNLHIEKEDSCWTEPIKYPVFSRHGGQCLARLPVQDGDKGNFMHVCIIQQGNVVPLTHGPFELTRILSWDEDQHLIYVMATSEPNPGQRHLYKIGDANSTVPWTCMTCQPQIDPDQNLENGTVSKNDSTLWLLPCGYNNIIFSSNWKYYIQECLGPEIPITYLVETSTNYRIAILDSKAALRKTMAKLAAPQVHEFSLDLKDSNWKYRAQVRLFYPPGLREYEEITYPLILLHDSRPGEQSISEKWQVSWAWYLASFRNFIVAQIDASGTGFQGERMRRQVHKSMGQVDVSDQLDVLHHLMEKKFVDRARICVVGWGYGGYLSAMMMSEDSKGFINCSVSIGPITSWVFYNAYFTEKYMGYPNESIREYDLADLTRRASSLANRNFLLVYGTADTDVKPIHSVLLARALMDQDVLFRQLVYPDEGHYFKDPKTQIHLFKEIDQFFDDSFGPVIFDEWDTDSGFFIQ